MEMEKIRVLSHFFVTVFLSGFASLMVVPAITDVTMLAVCPGQDQCFLAIYLTGFQQAIIGLGTVVMMPVIGNLSDKYGRKALLTLPMTLSIIPSAILAYSRETEYFYAYYVIRTLTGLVSDGSINSLSLAYLADNVTERQRASAFGILSGVSSASFICGTLAARFLNAASTFQVAALASILGTVYMRIFLKESICDTGDITRPILKGGLNVIQDDSDLSQRTAPIHKNVPSLGDIICFLKSSKTFLQAAVVAFFVSLENGGIVASLLYFLRARFHFTQTQFADIMLILGVAMGTSQLLFMPVLVAAISEETLLSIGLFMTFVHMFIYSLAWSVWVPYASTLFGVFLGFILPSLRSIASKQVPPNEQGMAQGCISSIESIAQIISPLIFSPLTAWFLSEQAPFHYPGFSLLCVGFASLIAFVQSVMIRPAPPLSSHVTSNSCTEA